MTLSKLHEETRKALEAGTDPNMPVYAMDTRNCAGEKVSSCFTDKAGGGEGAILLEKAPTVFLICF
jgi:hypothetical protein